MGDSKLSLAARAAQEAALAAGLDVPPHEAFRLALARALDRIATDDELWSLLRTWEWIARPEQLPPPGDWATWLVLAGRGFGKTRTGAQFSVGEIEEGRCGRFALIGPTASDARDVMVEGESGILSIYAGKPDGERPIYEPSRRRLTWPNGAIATTYSAEEPDRLRGPQHDGFWADELAAWQDPRGAWDQLQFGLRLGRRPRGIVTTTPRPIALVRELLKDATTAITRGTTYENAANLAPGFLKAIKAAYEGTRLGRQEIGAEVLDDNPGALWKLAQIEKCRVAHLPEDLKRIGVGVDPAVTSEESSDETGIITAGVAECRCKGEPELHGFVFDDSSGVYTPDGWAKATASTYHKYGADFVVPEANNGGDLVASNLLTLGDPNLKIVQSGTRKGVVASRGKRTRAEPISGLYEQGKVHHVGVLAKLEDQMTTWDPLNDDDSPDRVDALVWVLSWLMLKPVTISMFEAMAGVRSLNPRRVI